MKNFPDYLPRLLLAALLLPATLLAGEPEPAEPTAFERIVEHYEVVRLALLDDSTEGVADEARAILEIATELDRDWSAEAAGVHPEAADSARTLLPDVTAAAEELVAADSLTSARDAFYELSKPMLGLRKAAEGATSIVAYCPMAQRTWLQPEGEIGNPYYGQEMPTCGTVLE